ncbi:MAG: hypothetical protein MJ161_03005 [Clostridia bacterium]|nr:hypothetical protein [Clostridia bacterium]
MMTNSMKKAAGVLTAVIFAFSALAVSPYMTAFAAVDPSTLTSLDRYPGVKTFDFSCQPQRENVSSGEMVDPEYSIRLSKLSPDEYFGARVSQINDTETGQSIDGIVLGVDGVKGKCGCIYRRMFQYRDKWIDVKTTYMDWSVYFAKSSFMAGGFAQHRWRSTWWVEMKHEFFISGTNTPVEVKGFLEYEDVDNSQGLYLDMSEIEDMWVNSGGTTIGYKNIPGGVQYAQNSRATYVVDRNMLCVQSMTNDDIPLPEEAGYSAVNAARTCFAFTFSGSSLHSCMVDDDIQGFNVMNVSGSKNIPSAVPGGGTDLVAKRVSDEDETEVTSNSLRNTEGWTYKVNAMVPPETEPGNFYDGFSFEDRIDSDLTVGEVRIIRGRDEDVTDLFDIYSENNVVVATALDTQNRDFYGYEYFMYIDVTLDRGKDEMLREEKLDDNFICTFLNTAHVFYADGNGQRNISTNETYTDVQYEIEADIIISKRIRAADNYPEHGIPSFLFRLQGESLSGKQITLNGCVTISPGETEGTLRFRNVPEGEYRCIEYESLRFEPESITEVSGGRVSGNEVIFTIDSTDVRRASFMNRKKSWSDYSDSNVVINRIGIK